MAPPNVPAAPPARAQSRRYDVRVAIQDAPAADNAATQDSFGAVTADWTTARRAWCYIEAEAAGRIPVGGQAVFSGRYRIGFRRGVPVAFGQRIKGLNGKYRNTVFTVQAVDLLGGSRAEGVEAICVTMS